MHRLLQPLSLTQRNFISVRCWRRLLSRASMLYEGTGAVGERRIVAAWFVRQGEGLCWTSNTSTRRWSHRTAAGSGSEQCNTQPFVLVLIRIFTPTGCLRVRISYHRIHWPSPQVSMSDSPFFSPLHHHQLVTARVACEQLDTKNPVLFLPLTG